MTSYPEQTEDKRDYKLEVQKHEKILTVIHEIASDGRMPVGRTHPVAEEVANVCRELSRMRKSIGETEWTSVGLTIEKLRKNILMLNLENSLLRERLNVETAPVYENELEEILKCLPTYLRKETDPFSK